MQSNRQVRRVTSQQLACHFFVAEARQITGGFVIWLDIDSMLSGYPNIGLAGWGQSHIFRTCAGEPVVRFFRERSDFFRTSIVERLVVILKTMLNPQHMFFVVFNVILIIKTTFNVHNN